MTFERSIVVTLVDIRAILLECKQCGARKSIPREKIPQNGGFLDKCEVCGTGWWPEGSYKRPPSFPNHILALLETMRDIRTIEGTVGFTVLLEMDEPR